MPTTPAAAARQILVLLQEVMASRNSAQAKLNKVVEIIGQSLSSEVCSIYLVREGVLELFATRGLKQEAVHVTRMAMGEGLVGLIATNVETLNLDEAAAHPDFSYRPETGEDRFHSFAGVPIVRRERSIGVLCVQHVEPRRYEEVEIEALQTVAMVLSELIANAELADDGPADARVAETGTTILQGLQLVMGMARGHAVFHQPRIHVEHTVAEDTEAERARVISAFAKMREQIDRMTGAAEFGTEGEHQEVLETYKMFAYDEGWIRRINEAIDSGLTAEAAIERVQQRTRMRMRQIDDPLLQDRMHDLEDMANRLLRIVSGQLGTAAQLGLRQDAILIARNLGPAELLEYDRRRLKGVILEEGSLTAHVTIVARAMGVPVLGRVRDVRHKLNEGDLILLDVAENTVLIRPGPDMDEAFENKLHVTQKRRAEFAAMRDLPSVTTDGQRVELMVNAGLREDAQALDLVGADGIGLFRTEFQFLVSATLPQREKQQRLYKDVLDAAGDRPVIFRTVDIGGDKALPYMQRDGDEELEDNPAMGWRALRLALDRDGLMKAQARALLEASAGKVLNIMFPMVSEPWEYEAARDLVEHQREWLQGHRKKLPIAVKYGAMLEVPALAEVLDLLLPRVDFLSIGTNDLTQFLFAADRAHPKLAERYDWLSIAILRFLDRVVRACVAHQVPVGVCGEMGGRTLEAMALIGLGIRRLSITPASVGPVKAMIRAIDATQLQSTMREWLDSGAPDIRERLTQWASDRDVELT
ncbi:MULTISPECIES: phosphoenolpyruvate--protein phosphotransferase [Sphingomonadaceae]|jgi:phosphotransferase system, enzyme I, PtsP|uniref:phosphoenolpyruvate--protein phosphotransferase n=1 Tax=Sphingobium soli TaxID=1591116 RepID=A0ABS8GY82_9SPHN|nr:MULTISPECIES: phosphoenolpyruvate--protein phosphotransferase [Sphingomonadaceae]MEE2741136.1 phosphoenolpyruvate--protein phosphotransferase [Pseudomonadota bacterium]EAT08675.1 PTSINtr with GAF domain, PtsP [Sphingomonas sp. SKA58]MAX15239.1 phosphoenolpyruvate--protein phosphotransferase [Sphingobium sp.]MBS47888.1 phosphoenolpyruvate--protein phosphotransferase [Sphingobium sp.]MCC4231235.1 phosphoenolpyruvate--protein phosphotransferase [Sphingobium soli]|tara:strand:- start:4880 stop:7156 length:2277 start_codon:yes stop_codon:yes gene_type:complete